MLRLFLCHAPRAKKDVIWIWNYSELASSSDRTCAFFARLRARLQSVICAASRASLMKPLILETRSLCAALSIFPRAAPRFLSAMLRLSFVCCWAATNSCGVSCGTIVGASDFSVSFPVVAVGGMLVRGRGGAVRSEFRRLEEGGSSNRSSGSGSSETPFASAVCCSAMGFTCTAVAHGISGRLLMLHPPSTYAAQHRRMIELGKQRGDTVRHQTGFSLMLGREWQFDSKRGASANLRSKVYRTVEKLYNSKRTREPDSAASWTRGEKQLKNFLPVFRRNAFAGVAHRNFRHFAAPAQHQPQLSSTGHGFGRIQHQIQHRLFEQRPIHVHLRNINRQQLRQLNIRFLKLRQCELQYFPQKLRELSRLQADVHRPREIEKTLHDRVQPVDFLVQHLYGLPRNAV